MRWVGNRHAAGAGGAGAGSPPPSVHMRRDASGTHWAALAWPAVGELLPGVAGYVPTGAPTASERASWRTYLPFEEHGCTSRAEDDYDAQGQRRAPDELLAAVVGVVEADADESEVREF